MHEQLDSPRPRIGSTMRGPFPSISDRLYRVLFDFVSLLSRAPNYSTRCRRPFRVFPSLYILYL